MEYYEEGALRSVLHSDEMMKPWQWCVETCAQIASGLRFIHREGMMHRDLHSGNLLHKRTSTASKDNDEITDIADFGLSVAADSVAREQNGKYGVIPYMAPELFRGQPHTQSSDVYAFGIIMWEVSSQQSPFSGHDHDVLLMLEICNGIRPTIVDRTPKCWSDLMQRCWHQDQSKRPTADEIFDVAIDWKLILDNKRDDHDGIRQQFAEADTYRKQRPRPRRQELHSGACYSSRFIPHITDKLVSAYIQSQHNSLDIEQEEWAAEVSVICGI